MATLTAEARPLELGPAPDQEGRTGDFRLDEDEFQRHVGVTGVSLNGHVRTNAPGEAPTGAEDTAWLEPRPGVKPLARRIAGLRMRTDDGFVETLVAPIEIYQLPQGQLIRAVYYSLTVAIGTTADLHIIRWWLEPGGDDAALRANSLSFLHALHRPGELEMVSEDGGRIAALRQSTHEGFDPELAEALPFVLEVAGLEEWTGTRLPLPLYADAAEVRDVVEAAGIVRSRVVPLNVGRELTVTARPITEEPMGIDTLVVPHEIKARLLGVEVLLGTADLTLAVELIEAERLADGLVALRCRLAPGQSRSVSAHLYPPPTRSPRRRRSLVGSAPLPSGMPSPAVASDLRRNALAAFLDEELEDQGMSAELLAEVEKKWPE